MHQSAGAKHLTDGLLPSGEVNTPEQIRRIAGQYVAAADQLSLKSEASDAIECYFHALMLCPGNSLWLRRVGDAYTQLGQPENASLCYRGIVPDDANDRWLRAAARQSRIQDAADCRDVTVLPALPAESIPLTSPARNNAELSFPQFHHTATEAQASFCSVIDNGEIWFDGFNTVALDADGLLLEPHIKGNEYLVMSALEAREPTKLDGTACFLDARSSPIYYHWMLDVLPKLHCLQASGIPLQSIDQFIVKATSTFQLDTLLQCGIDLSRIEFAEHEQHYTADTLIVPFLKNDLGQRIPTGLGVGAASWIPRWLQSVFVSTASTAPRSERLYVTRATRGTRQIDNEDRLINALEQRGFTVVALENLSVPQQADLLHSCEWVVGVHGAGLTNLCFSRPGTRVVEIFSDYVVPCYWALSRIADLRYHQYMIDPVQDASESNTPREKNIVERRNQNIQLDVDDFIGYLDGLLAET